MHGTTSFANIIFPILYMLAYAASGLSISELVFSAQKFSRRIWLGLVIGLFLFSWLPALFAFFIDFTLLAQILGVALALALGAVSYILCRRKKICKCYRIKSDLFPLVPLLFIFIVGCILFSTHILKIKNGSYYVGQTTFGDLSMHIGFITSLAEQGAFPPTYSIFAGHTMSYPFLCETSSASLLLLGANLRAAYLLPSLWAYALVILGVYNFAEGWLKRRGRSIFATMMFFFGGGFGFVYFIDLINGSQTALSSLLNVGNNNIQTLLDGFYQTPTNIPAIGLRWVNPIVDMLIPQRATLFGWAILFPCLYLLCDYVRSKRTQNIIPLGILAGGLPLLHTHSFVALAIISAVYFLYDLFKTKKFKSIRMWLIYAAIAAALALPQLIGFTFKQTSESGMVRIGFNWANEIDSYLWFYVKNLGWIFLLLPIAFFALSKTDRRLYLGSLALWLVSECILFQPNQYDNNKLLFVCFLFTCVLVTKFVSYLYHRFKHHWAKRYDDSDADRVHLTLAIICSGIILAYLIVKALRMKSFSFSLGFGTANTILFLIGFSLCQFVAMFINSLKKKSYSKLILDLVGVLSSTLVIVLILREMWVNYLSGSIGITNSLLITMALLLVLAIFAAVLRILLHRESSGTAVPFRNIWIKAGASLIVYVFGISLFLSGAMTIVREYKSEYQAFSSSEISAANFILENTDSDAIFLTDYSWHLNPVAALSGRSIVCGTDTYLTFHGIDTNQRKADINSMYSYPESSGELFEQYGVDYVFIGNSERSNSNYTCNQDWFDSNYTVVYNSNGIIIYDMNDPL